MDSRDWLSFAVLVALVGAGLALRWRYGSLMEPLRARLGTTWPVVVRVVQLATVAVWLLVWLLVDEARRAELATFFQENAPWFVGWTAGQR